jgi:hypothetical protein
MKRLALIAALLLAACQPVPEKGDLGFGNEPDPVQVPESAAAADCIARNGTMQPVGRMQTMQCVVRYADAGKRCTDSDQCAGECRTADAARPAEGASVAGICQATSNQFGCFTRVEDGKAEATLCVD